MSGVRQHYIPRSLLNGFEAQRAGKYPQAYVFSKRRAAYLCTVNDIAVQKHFYSEEDPERETLDDKITNYEGRFSRLLSDLRELNGGDPVPNEVASEILVHLTVRGAFLRDFFGEAFKGMMAGMSKVVSRSEAMREAFQLDATTPNPVIVEEIEKMLEQAGGQLPRDLGRKFAIFSMRENFESFYEHQRPHVIRALESMIEKTQDLARDGHTKALEPDLVPDARLENLWDFSWRIETFPEMSLVLPDCVAVGIDRKGVAQSYLLSAAEEIDQIYLPISAAKLLVGARTETSALHPTDFNGIAARCSAEFFVAPRNSDDLKSLVQFIGTTSTSQITDIVAGALADLSGSRRKEASPGNAEKHASVNAPNYPIQFLGCAQQNEAEAIAATFNAIVVEIAKVGSLDLMCEVVFAANYEQALRSLERGFDCDPSTAVAMGDAMTPLVIREGRVRAVALLRCEVGRALLAEDPGMRSAALYVVVSMLFRIAHFGRFHAKLPDVLLKPARDPWENRLLDMANEAFCAYLGTRRASPLCPALVSRYRQAVLAGAAGAKEQILDARRRAGETKNVDGFVHAAMPWILQLLVQLAAVAGFCDGLDRPVDEGGKEKVGAALSSVGLSNWFAVYRRDLEGLFDRGANWRPDDLVALSTHVERILWQFGVFVWKADDGQCRLDGPTEWGPAQVENFNFNLAKPDKSSA